MSVANPNLPVPKNPQVFVVPLRITVDSDRGDVTPKHIESHMTAPLDHFLYEELADLLDRDEVQPQPFAFHGAAAEWPAACEAVPSELDAEIEKVLQAKEAAVLDQEFDRAAELREEGRKLIERRNRIACLGLPPALRTALAWALSYARANVDDLNDAYQEKGLVTEQHYDMLVSRFGLET